ncbi:hypothetical protein EH63_25690 [Escherichia coli]|nr:hypothetical protein EH63_25690 [Escherichia coli]
MQGEFDMSAATYSQQPPLFTAMLKQFRADITEFNTQCHGGRAASVPWICGDTTYYWKNTYGTQYDTIYGAYKNRESDNVFFVPFLTDGSGNNTSTNAPTEDPDAASEGYYGSASPNEQKLGIIKSPDAFQLMGASWHYSRSYGNRYSERSRSHLSLHQW